MLKRKIMAGGLALLLAGNAWAADKYVFDKSHTRVGFAVKHMLITTVRGHFSDFDGTIMYDQNNIENSSIDVIIKTASINTDNERRDNHLRSDDFFNAEQFPEITFKSKKISKTENGYVAVGDLTIRDVTKEVELPFQIIGTIKDRNGNTRMGVEAEMTIKRMDYGVKWSNTLDNGSLVVSDDVKIELALQLRSAGE